MRHARFGVLVMVSIGLLFNACKEKTKTVKESLTLDSASLTSTVYLNNDTSKIVLNLALNVVYPADFSDREVLNQVRRVVLMDYFPESDSLFSTPGQVLNAFIHDYKQFFFESESTYDDAEDEEDLYESDPWYINQSVKVRFNSHYLFSYTVLTDRYSGGAHGEKKFVNTVVNLKTGKKLTEDDLFTEEAKPMIVKLIVDKIMEQHRLKSVEALEEIGYFDVSELNLNNNFFLTDKGLTYTFNEYEIAGYAVGTTEVPLDFNSLSGYLKTDSPLLDIIK